MAKWEELPITDRAAYMRAAVKNGYRDIRSIREAYNKYNDGGVVDGGELPEVTVYPTHLTLRTYYPIISNYPYTGHSTLSISSRDPELRGQNAHVSKGSKDKGYNLLTNNCSDATAKVLETIVGKPIDTNLFTTPGDVQDYFKENFEWTPIRRKKGLSVIRTNISLADRNLLVDKIKSMKNGYAEGGDLGTLYSGNGSEPNILSKAWSTVTSMFGLEEKPVKKKTVYKSIDGTIFEDRQKALDYNRDLRRRAAANVRYKKNGYIGGTSNQARQKYFDIDKELSDSVKSISTRYGLNPELVASRMAKEGPIDGAIHYYNEERGTILSDNNSIGYRMYGPEWGLDDLGTRLNKKEINFTTTAPYDIDTDVEFVNEKGRTTYSVESPQWWIGIEGTAAELANRRQALKAKYPNLNDMQLDAAAAASFNYGSAGVKKIIDSGYYMNYKPFIKLR